MKKWIALTLLVLFAVCSATAPLWAAQKSAKEQPQTICPVMGDKIDKNVYVDYQGKRVYFCCTSCKAEFEKNPDKYMKKLESEGVTLEKSPAQ